MPGEADGTVRPLRSAHGQRILVAAVAALLLVVPVAAAQPPAPPAPIIPPPVQPANIGDLKTDAVGYYDSGAYLTNLQQAAAPAIAWINEQAPRVDRPAVVFDIDETALSNWEAIKANDFGRVIGGPCDELPQGPCGWLAWDLRAQSTVIPPTMDIFTTAKDRGAAIFFITGRAESQRAATERNLQTVGYTGYDAADHGTRWRALCFGRRLQGAAAGAHRGAGLHDHRQHRRPALRPGRRLLPADLPAAESLLPDPLTRDEYRVDGR